MAQVVRCHHPGLGSLVGGDAVTAPARERTTVVQLAGAERICLITTCRPARMRSRSARSGSPPQRRNIAIKRPSRAVARPGADACPPQRGTRLNSLTAEYDLIELFGIR